MNEVHSSEQNSAVHESVCPIKITVVHQEHDWKCEVEIEPSMVINMGVVSCVRSNGRTVEDDQWHRCEDGHCNSGIGNFPPIVMKLWEAWLYFPEFLLISEQHIEQKECEACHGGISYCHVLHHMEISGPAHGLILICINSGNLYNNNGRVRINYLARN